MSHRKGWTHPSEDPVQDLVQIVELVARMVEADPTAAVAIVAIVALRWGGGFTNGD